MGNYTYFIIKGKVKLNYRHKIQEIYDVAEKNIIPWNEECYFENLINHVGFDLFKDFKTGFRSEMIFFGCRNGDDRLCYYDEATGDWHLEIDIKNYPEEGKPKNSMEMFKDTFSELFEEGLFFSELYEEDIYPVEYRLLNENLTCVNPEAIKMNRRFYH